MDHLSSSSSLTGTTTFTQQSVSTFHQDVPRQTYTTAGTIYKPNAAQPLQPPVRRGRTLKWPPPGGPPSELSLFPKSVLASLPMKAQSLCTTPISPLPGQIPKYSPLQQNYDRAVSPLTDYSRESLNDLDIRSLSTSRMSSFTTMNTPQISPVEVRSPLVLNDKHVVEAPVSPLGVKERHFIDADFSDEEEDDATSENPLKMLTVKSLHNLASYPNPNQKRAQKALLRARPGATPAPSTGTNGSRSATPAFSGGLSYGDASDTTKDGWEFPGLFRDAKSDPTQVLKLQADTKSGRDLSGPWRAGAGANSLAPPPGLSNTQNVQRSNHFGGYKSTLATGPGAPLPLTAGPPGQRQYRVSTFESTMKALQNGPQVEIGNERSINLDVRAAPPGLPQNATNANDLFRQSSMATPDNLKASLTTLVQESEPDRFDWKETLDRVSGAEMEKLLDAIAHSDRGKGLRDFTQTAQPQLCYGNTFNAGSSYGEDMEDQPKPPGTPRTFKPGTSWITDEELRIRNERISRHFYAGTGELGRPLDDVLKDAEERQFRRNIGAIGDGRPTAKPEKVEYSPMTAQMVNRMTDAEAAEPLVTMTFSSFLNNIEAGIRCDQFYHEKPAQSLVDRSEVGRQTVFGNSFEGGKERGAWGGRKL